jgi:hypothetical protein
MRSLQFVCVLAMVLASVRASTVEDLEEPLGGALYCDLTLTAMLGYLEINVE